MSSDAPAARAALSGVRVLDLTQFEAGPSTTQALAWLGAEVIKVEPPGGEQSRATSAEEPGMDSPYFLLLNANKLSVTCNLKHEKGRAVVKELIAKSDVFIENFGPGTIERLGFGYEEVSKINPRIIYAQIKGFTPDGPYANYLSFDMIAQAVGGAMSINGDADGRPLRSGATLADTGSGLHCVIGILAALYQRQFTGRGQRIEIVMQEVVTNMCRVSYAAQAQLGKAAHRNGNQSLINSTSPSEAYRCKGDGPNDYCFIYSSRATNRHWERLLEVMGRQDLIGDPRYTDPVTRFEYHEEIDKMISDWTRKHDKREVMRILGEAGVAAGAVFDTSDLSSDPNLRARDTMVTIKHPKRGDFVMPGWPVKMTDSHIEAKCAPPLGRDTDDVLKRILGRSVEQISELRREKAI